MNKIQLRLLTLALMIMAISHMPSAAEEKKNIFAGPSGPPGPKGIEQGLSSLRLKRSAAEEKKDTFANPPEEGSNKVNAEGDQGTPRLRGPSRTIVRIY